MGLYLVVRIHSKSLVEKFASLRFDDFNFLKQIVSQPTDDILFIPRIDILNFLKENPYVSIVDAWYPSGNEDSFMRIIGFDKAMEWMKAKRYINEEQFLATILLMKNDKQLWLIYR